MPSDRVSLTRFGDLAEGRSKDAGLRIVPATPRRELRDRIDAALDASADGSRVDLLEAPEISIQIGFHLAGRVLEGSRGLPEAVVMGVRTRASRFAYPAGTATFMLRLTVSAAACLGVPAHAITDEVVALGDVLGDVPARILAERIRAAVDVGARMTVMEDFLRDRPLVPDSAMDVAMHRLTHEPRLRIAAVARELDLSERQFARRFQARAGITPKRYQQLRRFERALELSTSVPSLGWLAAEAGYADQSHLVRAFRDFTGCPPSAILTSGDDVSMSDSYKRTGCDDGRRPPRGLP